MAAIIDGLVFSPLLVIFVAVSGAFGLLLHPLSDMDVEGLTGAMFGVSIFAGVILFLAGNWLYQVWMESSRYQATLGKMAMGIMVTDMDGNRISFGRANGRHFGKIVSGMILNLGYLMAGFTEKKQALHDMLANCLVVMK